MTRASKKKHNQQNDYTNSDPSAPLIGVEQAILSAMPQWLQEVSDRRERNEDDFELPTAEAIINVISRVVGKRVYRRLLGAMMNSLASKRPSGTEVSPERSQLDSLAAYVALVSLMDVRNPVVPSSDYDIARQAARLIATTVNESRQRPPVRVKVIVIPPSRPRNNEDSTRRERLADVERQLVALGRKMQEASVEDPRSAVRLAAEVYRHLAWTRLYRRFLAVVCDEVEGNDTSSDARLGAMAAFAAVGSLVEVPAEALTAEEHAFGRDVAAMLTDTLGLLLHPVNDTPDRTN